LLEFTYCTRVVQDNYCQYLELTDGCRQEHVPIMQIGEIFFARPTPVVKSSFSMMWRSISYVVVWCNLKVCRSVLSVQHANLFA